MNQTDAQPDALMGWMECLSDPTRLRLLRLLERRELGVQELCDVLQLPQSTVSRHLKVLADRAWLANRREGTSSLYRLDTQRLDAGARRLWTISREQTDGWATLRQDRLRLDRLVGSRRAEAQTFFAGAAGRWDKLRGELYGNAFTREAMLALLPRGWTIADLGCGTAQLTCELASHVEHIIGVDQSAEMLAAAKKRVASTTRHAPEPSPSGRGQAEGSDVVPSGQKRLQEKRGALTPALSQRERGTERGRIDLRRGELEAIPIDDATCDAAMLVLVLTYIADPGAVLREAARILKPGGRVVVVDLLEHDREDFRVQMGQHWLGFSAERLRQLLSSAGLAETTVRSLPPEPGAKGPALVLATGERGRV